MIADRRICPWAGYDLLSLQYHDTEWGIPLHDEGRLFELLVLEGMQAGLSWSIILNKRQALRQALRDDRTSLDQYLWDWVDGRPLVNRWQQPEAVPAQTPLSEALSRDLKRRGFSFVGPTIGYSLMQAAGLVCDHLSWCDRHPDHHPATGQGDQAGRFI